MSSCVEPEVEILPEATASASVPIAGRQHFHRLYRDHFDKVTSFVMRFGIRADDAEDLVQRVFVIALRQCDVGIVVEQPTAWLRAIALRVIHEHYRWWRVRRAAQWLVEQTWAGRHQDDCSPEREASAAQSLEQVRAVLCRMSGKLRDAFVLLDVEGLSSREAAELLGISHNTMRSRHNLARDEFMRLWQANAAGKETSDG